VKHLLGLATLLGLAFILHEVWPSNAIDALGNDPDAVLRWPWSEAPTEVDGADADGTTRSTSAPTASLDAPGTSVPPNALRVLFVGNSHTHVNAVPELIAELAFAAGEARPFAYAEETSGGATLTDHVAAGRVAARLSHGKWDYVVLQEQQQAPSFSREQREREFLPPARALDTMARAAGARTVLYMTWARRDGDPRNRPGDTFAAMQARMREGYFDVARELHAELAPVGIAWRWALQKRPDLPLWAPDGMHAGPLGSYLAACVLYATLYGHSVEGNDFTAGLPPDAVAIAQRSVAVAQAMR